MRRPLWVVLGSLVAILGAMAAFAPPPLYAAQSESGLRVEAVAAFGGAFKYGEWLPVWVSLENAGRDLEGQIQVLVQGRGGSTTYAVEVSLPGGSRKRVPVYVLPNNYSRELEVQVVDGQGAVQAKQTVQVKGYPNVTFLTGLAAPERGALAAISGAGTPDSGRPVVLVSSVLEELPDRMESLRSFDALVLNDVDSSSLSLG